MSKADVSLEPDTARSARFSLALLLAINLFNYIDRFVLAAVEPRISDTFFGRNDESALTKTGLLSTAFTFSYMLAAPIFGWLADRMSRWTIVAVGVILWSLASGASGLAPTFAILLVTRLFIGIGEAGYGPAAPTIISDLYPVQQRGQKLAWFYLALPVGGAIGYIWGGLFAGWLGWRWAFYSVVPPGLVLGAVCFFRQDHRRTKLKDHTVSNASLRDYLTLLQNRSYVLDCAGMTAMTFAIGGISFWMPHYIAEYRQAGSLANVNSIFGIIVATAGFAATLLGGIVGDKLRGRVRGAYFLVSGIGILLSCPFVFLMLCIPFPAAWAAIFAAVFFLFFNTGPSNTILANVTRPTIRATAFALNIFVIHILGDAISPPVLGALVGSKDQPRWNFAFLVVIAVMIIASILWLCGARYLDQDTATAEASGLPSRGFGVTPKAVK